MNQEQTTSVPQPLPHQRECLSKIGECLRQGISPILFVMASGLGKTYTAAFAYQMFRQLAKRSRVLFLAHQVDLLDQAKDTFENVFRDQLSYGHFDGRIRRLGTDAVFATLQSVRATLRWQEKSKKHRPVFRRRQFDAVFVDESHHGQATTYREVIEYFRPKLLVGMTATPDRMDLRDIREIFGKEVFNLDLESALKEGLLTPVEYSILADEIVDRGEIKVPPHKVSIRSLNRTFFCRKRDQEIVTTIRDKIAGLKNPQVLVFTASIPHAETFATLLPNAVAIHSSVPYAERQRRLKAVRQGESWAVTVDQFNEGVDIPEANVLVFLRSTQSRTVFYQQLGRGLRRVAGKEKVFVLDFVANCDRLALLDFFHRRMETVTAKRRQAGGSHSEIKVSWGNISFEERAEDVLKLLRLVNRTFDKDILAQYLKDFFTRNGRAACGGDLIWANEMPNSRTYQRHFGSLEKAYRYANIPITELRKSQALQMAAHGRGQGWVEQRKLELAEQLRQLRATLGRIPNSDDLESTKGVSDPKTYRRHFGSLEAAFRFAGLDLKELTPPQQGMRASARQASAEKKRQQLAKALQLFYHKKKRGPNVNEFCSTNGLRSLDTYERYFGTREAACAYAKIPFVKQLGSTTHLGKSWRKMSPVERKEILNRRLRQFHELHGIPKKKDFGHETTLGSYATFIKYFGSIPEWCQLVGIPTEPNPQESRRSRFKAKLLEFYQRTGRRPKSRELGKSSGLPDYATLFHNFGGLINACREAGIPEPPRSD